MARTGDSKRFDDRDAVVGPWGNPRTSEIDRSAVVGAARRGGRTADRSAGAERLVFVWMLGVSLLFAPIIMLAVGLPWTSVLALSGVVLAMIAIGLWGVMAIIWRPWARRFPARPVAADATVRLFGSASLGRLGGCNNCLEVASDDACVHLRLMPPFSWLRPERISLPRELLVDRGRESLLGELVWLRIGSRHIALPTWSLAPGHSSAPRTTEATPPPGNR